MKGNTTMKRAGTVEGAKPFIVPAVRWALGSPLVARWWQLRGYSAPIKRPSRERGVKPLWRERA
ncbi:protein of unknown function [Paraburkholderia kururiensis]